ncbi:MAG: DUF4153 domain-containing protein [Peptoniphilaceae bacterium]
MKIINSILNTLNKTKSSFQRFPLAMLSIFISFIFFMIGENKKQSIFLSNVYKGNEQLYIKYGYLFFILTIILVLISLLNELLKNSARDEEELKKFKLISRGAYILTIPLIYALYNNVIFKETGLFLYEDMYKYFGLLAFFSLVVTYIAKINYHKDYVFYFIKILKAGMISLGYSFIMLVGLFSIYYAVQELFGEKINPLVYTNTALAIFLPFNFGVFFSNFPKIRDSLVNYKISKVIKVLINYIIIPIFTIYAIILYLYFAKIILIKSIPEGIISNLVLWFCLLSIFLLFITTVIKDIEISKIFNKIFPIILLPLLIMLFYAIGIRIYEYGFTESRYYVLMGGIFSFISMLYYIFYKDSSNITIIILFSIIILISSVGPLNAYNISATSQNKKFESILLKNKMIKDNKIIPKSDIDKNDKKAIESIVNYMTVKHRPWELKYIPKDYENNEENFEKLLGFKYTKDDSELDSVHFNYDRSYSITIAGYTNMVAMNLSSNNDIIAESGNYTANIEDGVVNIDYKSKDEFTLVKFSIKEVFDKYKAIKNSNQSVTLDYIAIKGSENGINYKIIFTSLESYQNSLSPEKCDYDFSFYILTDSEQ